jgi:uncharacterized protein
MLPLIEKHLDEIAAACRRHGVKELQLFGSAARGDFDPVASDVDFLIEFQDYNSPAIADQWFGIQEDLEKILGRKVDLTDVLAIKNRYFLEAVARDKVRLYAA